MRISMDGKGRLPVNIFIKNRWRTLKFECVYLQAWQTGSETKPGIWKEMTVFHRHRSSAVVYWPRKDGTQPDQQMQIEA